MAKEEWNDPSVPLPPEEGLAVGLTMIPKGWKVLADKGFTLVSRHFPHFNLLETPTRMTGRKNGRLGSSEVKGDRVKCKLRCSCEVYFARVTAEELLKDVIEYGNFRVLPNVQAWSHAAANLLAPLQMPANTDYFN